MVWSGLAASLLGGGFDMGGQLLGRSLGKGAAKDAFSYQKRILKNQIQWRVQDMRKAGLNPILAVSPGAGGGPSGPDVKTPLGGAPGSSAINSALALQQMKQLDAQAYKLKAEGEKQKAEADAIKKHGLGATTWLGRIGHSAATGFSALDQVINEPHGPGKGRKKWTYPLPKPSSAKQAGQSSLPRMKVRFKDGRESGWMEMHGLPYIR